MESIRGQRERLTTVTEEGSPSVRTMRAEISTDPTDRRLAWNDRLEKWFSGTNDPNYAVVRIVPCWIVALPIGGGPDTQVWER